MSKNYTICHACSQPVLEDTYMNHLAHDLVDGVLILNKSQQKLFDAIFKGRESQKKSNNVLGEGLYIVMITLPENIDKEIEWWIPVNDDSVSKIGSSLLAFANLELI